MHTYDQSASTQPGSKRYLVWFCLLFGLLSLSVLSNAAHAVSTPTGLSAPSIDTDGSNFRATWNAVTDADRYELQRRKNNGAWSTIHSHINTYKWQNGLGEGTYDYRVRACLGTNCSDYSASVRTIVDYVPSPSGWMSLPTSADNGNFSLSWGGSGGASTYKLQRRLVPGGWSTIQTSTSRSRTENGLGTGVWGYRVISCTSNNVCSAPSAEKQITTSATPDAPTGFGVTQKSEDGTVNLTWNTETSAEEYWVFRDNQLLDSVQQNSVEYTGLANGTYEYRVVACLTYNGIIFCGPGSNNQTATVQRPPADPSSFTVPKKSTTGNFTIEWASSAGATNYLLWEDHLEGNAVIHDLVGENSTSQSYSGAAQGTYTFGVQACIVRNSLYFCSSGGGWQDLVVHPAPATPTGFVAPVGTSDGTVSLSWDEVSGAEVYLVQQNLEIVANLPAEPNPTAVIENVVDGSHQFRVSACVIRSNLYFCSNYTDELDVIALTAPPQPTGLSVPALSKSGDFNINWNEVAEATDYVVTERPLGGSWTFVSVAPDRPIAVTGKPNGTYEYRVQACVQSGGEFFCSDPTEVETVVVQLPPSGVPVLTGPTSSVDGSYSLSWTSVGSDLDYALVERFNGGAPAIVYVDTGLSHAMTGRVPGTYEYTVRACTYVASVDEHSCGDASSALTVVVTAVGDPGDFWGGPGDVNYGTDPVNDPLTGGVYRGKVDGSFSVGKDGSANYLIPIELPPGINAMQPELSLAYNSNRRNGLLGWGWALSGQSKITRCRSSVARDGKNSGTLDDDDFKYCLDGQRLVEIAAGEYRTESESYSRVKRYGSDARNPTKWTVETRNGKTYAYGDGNNSMRISTATGAKAFEWHLNRITDIAGNYIELYYERNTAQGTHRPLRIEYTKNDSAPNTNQAVEFVYETRPDPVEKFVSGSLFRIEKRLTEVRTLSGTDQVSNYVISYQEPGTTYFGKTFNDPLSTSRIASVSQCFAGVSTNCAAPLTFDWSSTDVEDYTVDLSTDAQFDEFFEVSQNIDFDGNLIRDHAHFVGDDLYLTVAGTQDQFVAALPGPYEECKELTLDSATQVVCVTHRWGAANEPLVIDLNSDGFEDLLILAPGWREQGAKAFISDGQTLQLSGNYDSAPSGGYSIPIGSDLSYPVTYRTGEFDVENNLTYRLAFRDFNGDGLVDILRYPPAQPDEITINSGERLDISIALNTGVGFSAFQEWMTMDLLPDLYGNAEVADINGDGLPDIVASNGAAAINMGNATEGFVPAAQWRLAGRSSEDNRTRSDYGQPVRMADINCDNIADFVQAEPNQTTGKYDIGVAFSDGSTFSAIESVYSYTTSPPGSPPSIFFEDLNGDGCADIVIPDDSMGGIQDAAAVFMYKEARVVDEVTLLTSDRSGGLTALNAATGRRRMNTAYSEIEAIYRDAEQVLSVDYAPMDPFDVLGDYSPADWDSPIYTQESPNQANGVGSALEQISLASMADEDSGEISVTRKALTKRGVRTYLQYDGIGGDNLSTHSYYNSAYDSRGFGSLGFAKTIQIEQAGDASEARVKETYYSQAVSAEFKFAGRKTKQIVSATDANRGVLQELSTTDYRWRVRTWQDDIDSDGFDSPHYFPYLESSVTTHTDLDGTFSHYSATQNFLDDNLTCTPARFDLEAITEPPPQGNYSHDDDGNLKYYQEVTCDEHGLHANAVARTFTSVNSSSRWVLGLEDIRNETSYAITGSSGVGKTYHAPTLQLGEYLQRTTDSSYNGLGQLATTQLQPGTALEFTSTYGYDGYGLVSSITENWADQSLSFTQRTRSKNYSFASNGQMTLVETDALGQNETTVYNGNYGLPVSYQDIAGRSTHTSYDEYGRESLVTYPDSTQRDIDYRVCTGCFGGSAFEDYYVQVKDSGSTATLSYFDAMDREVGTRSRGLDNEVIYTETQYDSQGNVKQVVAPYFAGAGAAERATTVFDYDSLNRLTTTTRPDGTTEINTYSGLVSTTVSQVLQSGELLTQQNSLHRNAQGQVVRSVDNHNTTVDYTYHPFGDLHTTVVAGNSSTEVTVVYDLLGRKLSIDDPNTGSRAYSYNALDLVATETDAEGRTTQYQYDKLGRQISRTDPAYTYSFGGTGFNVPTRTHTWSYHLSGNGKGKLKQLSGFDTEGDSFTESYTYNNVGLLDTTTTTMFGDTYTVTQHYDRFSRPIGISYPNNYVLGYAYNDYGVKTLAYEWTAGGNTILWKLDSTDARGNATQFTQSSDGVSDTVTVSDYDPHFGRVSSIRVSNGAFSIQDHDYTFDTIGNLTQRIDHRFSVTQDMCYDGLNRLLNWGSNPCGSGNALAYDALGNITDKAFVGSYQYASNRPHAVTGIDSGSRTRTYAYDNNGSITGATTSDNSYKLDIAYSVFGKPISMETQFNSLTNRSDIVYGPDKFRIQRRDTGPNGNATTRYVGKLYEEVTEGSSVVRRYYLDDFAIFEQHSVEGDSYFNLHHDHLGSVVAKSNGLANTATAISWQANDPWGLRQDENWSGAGHINDYVPFVSPRGFTGHEHLDGVGLIHMNGRVYDPVIGRFISADPFVQDPHSAQSFNRYSYVMNNPLSNTDPSGYVCFVSGSEGGGESRRVCTGDTGFYGGLFLSGLLDQLMRGMAMLDLEAMALAGVATQDSSMYDQASALNEDLSNADLVTSESDSEEAGAIAYEQSKGKPVLSAALGIKKKSRNKVKPVSDADGPHTTWKTDPKTGEITRHETYVPNAKNPTGFDKAQSTDLRGAPHVNKKTGEAIPTPHTQGRHIPGGVRPATPDEIPKPR